MSKLNNNNYNNILIFYNKIFIFSKIIIYLYLINNKARIIPS